MARKETLKVRVEVIVTIDLDEYREAYGNESVEEIRYTVKQAAVDGMHAVLSQGIREAHYNR